MIVVSFATAPAFALSSDSLNLWLVGVMSISPIFILLSLRLLRFSTEDMLLIFFLISIILAPLINHPESMRWSTVIYSCMFGFTFIMYKHLLLRGIFKIEHYLKLLQYIIYWYAIVILIQQFCVLTGLPIFNVSLYNPDDPWKLNSLTSEPSHSARILGLLMFSYIAIIETITGKKYVFNQESNSDKWVWFSFLWTMITMKSGLAFLFLTVIFSMILSMRQFLLFLFLLSAGFIIINMFGITEFERTFRLTTAVFSFDIDRIIEADSSGAVRIIPLIILSDLVNLTTVDGWLGHGIDYVSTILSDLVYIGGMPAGWSGGGTLLVWMEYGFISFFLFISFSLISATSKSNSYTYVFWFLLIFIYGVNNQIVWLTIILTYTYKYFDKKIVPKLTLSIPISTLPQENSVGS